MIPHRCFKPTTKGLSGLEQGMGFCSTFMDRGLTFEQGTGLCSSLSGGHEQGSYMNMNRGQTPVHVVSYKNLNKDPSPVQRVVLISLGSDVFKEPALSRLLNLCLNVRIGLLTIN